MLKLSERILLVYFVCSILQEISTKIKCRNCRIKNKKRLTQLYKVNNEDNLQRSYSESRRNAVN